MANKTLKSVQEIQNLGFDDTYNVSQTIPLTKNPVSGNLEYQSSIQGNASLTVSEAVEGTVTTKTLTKTIGSTSYVKTVESDSSDNSVTVSTWSTV
jgi:hypothetical protein